MALGLVLSGWPQKLSLLFGWFRQGFGQSPCGGRKAQSSLLPWVPLPVNWTFTITFFKLTYDWFTMLYYLLLYGKVTQLYMYIHTHTYIFFFTLFSITAYHRILKIVPCAIQYVFVVFSFGYTMWLVRSSPTRNGTWATTVNAQNLNHKATGEVLGPCLSILYVTVCL